MTLTRRADRGTDGRRPAADARRRFGLWWAAQTEIHELTRDREHEAHSHAEAAIRLDPGPWALLAAFRPAPSSVGADDASRQDETDQG